MRIKTFSGLVMLLLLAVFSVPTIRTQTTNKPKTTGESFAPGKERSAREKSRQQDDSEPPRDAEEWYSRAYRMHSSDRYLEAIEGFKRAIDLGYRKGTAMYNIACGYSLLNDKENALVWLQRSFDNGFDLTERIFNDSDLDPLRTDARFKRIMDSLPKSDDESDPEKSWKKKRKVRVDRLEQANQEYARLNQEQSTDGQEWAGVGMRMLLLRDLDRGITALLKAVNYSQDDASGAMYNLACAYSMKGDRDSGIQWLERSVNSGFDSPQKLSYDPDINNLRSDSRFASIEKLNNTLSLSQFKDEREDHKDRDDFRYNKERWAPAISLFDSFVKNDPKNGRGWFNLGYALHYSREHSRAIDAWQHALDLGYHKGTVAYDIACAYSMLNQRDQAFEWLEKAFNTGFGSNGNLSWDKDLDNLRSDPRFRPLVERSSYNRKSHSKE